MIIMIFGGFLANDSRTLRVSWLRFSGGLLIYMCTFLKLLCKLLMYEYSISEFSWVSMGLFGVGFVIYFVAWWGIGGFLIFLSCWFGAVLGEILWLRIGVVLWDVNFVSLRWANLFYIWSYLYVVCTWEGGKNFWVIYIFVYESCNSSAEVVWIVDKM